MYLFQVLPLWIDNGERAGSSKVGARDSRTWTQVDGQELTSNRAKSHLYSPPGNVQGECLRHKQNRKEADQEGRKDRGERGLQTETQALSKRSYRDTQIPKNWFDLGFYGGWCGTFFPEPPGITLQCHKTPNNQIIPKIALGTSSLQLETWVC